MITSTNGTRWRVLKFGGTSVASSERWARIEQVVRQRTADGLTVALVCSAVAGVTDLLTDLVSALREGRPGDAIVETLRARHRELGAELGVDADAILTDEFQTLETVLATPTIDERAEAILVGLGEMMSTRLGAAWLQQREVPCLWVDAKDLLTADPGAPGAPQNFLSATCTPVPDPALSTELASKSQVIITQGFVARSTAGETVLLGRGGSDTSAAYIACLLAAERLEIWTDVPGLFTANPRLISEARLLRRVGYRAAQALGALGAKVLHPRAIEAVWEHGVPIELGWTECPDVEGTQINASRSADGIQAITSRRNLAMFSLRRPPSWQPVGFLADVASCFARRGLSMDLLSSSCSEIRATLDLSAFPGADEQIPDLLRELEQSCHAQVRKPVASVSIVGTNVSQALLGTDSNFGLSDEALLMMVHAANEHHVSVVLDEAFAEELVAKAHARLIETNPDLHDLGPTWAELTAQKVDRQEDAA